MKRLYTRCRAARLAAGMGAALWLMLAGACKDKAGELGRAATATPASGSTATTDDDAPTEWGEKIKVKTPDKSEVLSVQQADGRVKLKTAAGTLKAKTKGDKTTYADDAGRAVAVVKDRADGFKIKGVDGALWAKVKKKDYGMKVSLDDEGERAYKAKPHGDKVKVKRDDKELGAVKVYDDKVKVKRGEETLFESKGKTNGIVFAPLLMDELSEQTRHILVAELVRRGW